MHNEQQGKLLSRCSIHAVPGMIFSSLVLVSVFTLFDARLNGLTYFEKKIIGEGIKNNNILGG